MATVEIRRAQADVGQFTLGHRRQLAPDSLVPDVVGHGPNAFVDEPRHGDHQVRQPPRPLHRDADRSEEHTSELQSLMRISYAVFCLNNNNFSYKFINIYLTILL